MDRGTIAGAAVGLSLSGAGVCAWILKIANVHRAGAFQVSAPALFIDFRIRFGARPPGLPARCPSGNKSS